MNTLRIIGVVAALCVALACSAAEPSGPAVAPNAPAVFVPSAPPQTVAIRRNPFGGTPLSPATLASKRGGENVANTAQLSGTVVGNQATNVTTGTNTIGEGAFAGSAGLSTVIQNTGNNVLIQNSIIVNVQLK